MKTLLAVALTFVFSGNAFAAERARSVSAIRGTSKIKPAAHRSSTIAAPRHIAPTTVRPTGTISAARTHSSASQPIRHNIIRRDDGGGQAPAPAPTPDQGPQPVAGALVRTEGLGFKISEPSQPERTFAVEAGNRIAVQDNLATSLTNAPGVFTGTKDTPPRPNPSGGGGGASGATAITERPSLLGK